MRKNKFRAYDKKLNYIFYGIEEVYLRMAYENNNNDDMVDKLNETFNAEGFTSFLNNDRFIVMQYTGLNDDNNNEIYEDDIVEVQDMVETKTSYRSKVKINHNGVLIDAHPAHKKIGLDDERLLSQFIDNGVGYQFNLKCKVVGDAHTI